MKRILLSTIFAFLIIACQGREDEPLASTTTQYETLVPDETEISIAPTEVVGVRTAATTNDGECLPPLETFAFNPAIEGVSGPTPTQKLPSVNWQAATTIPDYFPLGNSASLEVLQTVDGEDRIWVIFFDTKKYRITYYQTDTGRWKEIDYAEEYSVSEPHIFLKNNSLWLALNRTNYGGINTNETLLSVYNETAGQFETVIKVKDIPSNITNQSLESMKVTHIQVDNQGNMWLLLIIDEPRKEAEYQLFKFSPSSHTLERYLGDVWLDYYNGGSLVISQENILYLLDTEKNNLISYNPIKGEVEEIEIPVKVSSISSLFLDNRQRLWINDKAYLDLLDGDWYLIVNSPGFIIYEFGRWTHTLPVYSLQTEDGRLWYSAIYRGSGWVDPKIGKWCIFTSYPSNIAEDSNGHLWMVADGKLYKNSLQQ